MTLMKRYAPNVNRNKTKEQAKQNKTKQNKTKNKSSNIFFLWQDWAAERPKLFWQLNYVRSFLLHFFFISSFVFCLFLCFFICQLFVCLFLLRLFFCLFICFFICQLFVFLFVCLFIRFRVSQVQKLCCTLKSLLR